MYLVVCWYDLTCFRYVFANIFRAAPKAVVMCLYNMNCCPSPCRHFPLSVLPDTFVRSKESYRVKNQTDRKQYRCKSLSLSLFLCLFHLRNQLSWPIRASKNSRSLGLFQNQTEIHRTSESCSTHWSTCSFSQLLPSQFTQVQESHRKQQSLHFTPSLVKPKC